VNNNAAARGKIGGGLENEQLMTSSDRRQPRTTRFADVETESFCEPKLSTSVSR